MLTNTRYRITHAVVAVVIDGVPDTPRRPQPSALTATLYTLLGTETDTSPAHTAAAV
jgi:hypothetical protein